MKLIVKTNCKITRNFFGPLRKPELLSLHLNSDWKLPILDYTNLAARGESGLKKGQIIPECRLLMRFMAEDVKLEMTGAGAILQSNFLFPG